MRPNDVYNFGQLLANLLAHDWSTEPYVLLLGPESSGKTTVQGQVLRSLKNRGLLISVDARDIRIEGELVQRALVCARPDELQASRISLQSTQTKTVIAGSTFNQSTFMIKPRRALFSRRRESIVIDPNDTATAMVSTLISDLLAVHREVFLVIDHYDEAESFLHRFVDHLGQRLGGVDELRIMLVGSAVGRSQNTLGGVLPVVHRVHKLGWNDIKDWAEQLDLPVSEDNARLLHSLTDRGCAGAIRTELMKLVADNEWKPAPHPTRTS